MSWQSINEMLGLAIVDQTFCRQLLADPVGSAKARGFELTEREEAILLGITAHDLHEFSQAVLAYLSPGSRQTPEDEAR